MFHGVKNEAESNTEMEWEIATKKFPKLDKMGRRITFFAPGLASGQIGRNSFELLRHKNQPNQQFIRLSLWLRTKQYYKTYYNN